ncbi:MAG TPA: helix-turn-helix domain-containing protein [Natrialbaceae archaeon]|nr:helix-turn-helix domain-containing protein [Natrialbaceae archaeon]
MPIKLDSDDGDEVPPVRPGTNAHELLSVLLDHPDMGFTPRELADLTDVPHSSVHKTLSRLREKGLVRQVDSYWAVTDDIAASRVANLVSLRSIEAQYGDDAYGEDDDWAETVPDLGENA